MAFEFTPPPVDSLEPEAFTPPPLDSLQPMTERDSKWLRLNAERESARVEQDVIDDSSALRRVVADPAIALAKGVISVPEAAVGLADIVSKGRAGKAMEDAGFKFREAKDILSSYQTAEQQLAQGRVASAKGLIPTVKALAENPTVAAESIIESLPLMFGGGAFSQAALKGIAKIGPKFAAWAAGASAPVVAGAVGEGVVGAGSAAENIRQQSPDRLLTWEQAGYAAASGVGTAGFGILGGKAAQKLGLEDIQTALARGGVSAAQKTALPKFKAIIAGALQEGALEELPQSAQEQMFSNLALGKPWDEGLAEAAAQGFVAGAAMGGGVQAVRRGQPAAATPPPIPTQPAPVAPIAPATPPAAAPTTPRTTPAPTVPPVAPIQQAAPPTPAPRPPVAPIQRPAPVAAPVQSVPAAPAPTAFPPIMATRSGVGNVAADQSVALNPTEPLPQEKARMVSAGAKILAKQGFDPETAAEFSEHFVRSLRGEPASMEVFRTELVNSATQSGLVNPNTAKVKNTSVEGLVGSGVPRERAEQVAKENALFNEARARQVTLSNREVLKRIPRIYPASNPTVPVTPPATPVADAKAAPVGNSIPNIDALVAAGGGKVRVVLDGKEVDFDKFGLSIDEGVATVAYVEIKDKGATGKGLGKRAYIALGQALLERGITLQSSGALLGPGQKLWASMVRDGYAARKGNNYAFTGKPATHKPRRTAITPEAQAAAPRLTTRPEASMPARPVGELGIERGRVSPVDPDLAAAVEDIRGGYSERTARGLEGEVSEVAPATLASEYDAARSAFSKVSKSFREAQVAYRSKSIGDAEFLAARKRFDEAQEVFDKAESKFIEETNRAAESSAPAAVKEPWQMTVEEAVAVARSIRSTSSGDEPVLVIDKATGNPVTEVKRSQVAKLNTKKYEARELGGGPLRKVDPTIDDGWIGNVLQRHKQNIEAALREGKPVPPEVLADYPELTQKGEATPAAVKPVQQEAPASSLTPAERATPAGQKKMASEAASVATVSILNKRVREKSPGDAWDDKQIQAATGNQSLLNSIRDDLLPIFNRLYKQAEPQPPYAPQEQAPVEVLRNQPPGTPAQVAEGKPGEVLQAAGQGEAAKEKPPELMSLGGKAVRESRSDKERRLAEVLPKEQMRRAKNLSSATGLDAAIKRELQAATPAEMTPEEFYDLYSAHATNLREGSPPLTEEQLSGGMTGGWIVPTRPTTGWDYSRGNFKPGHQIVIAPETQIDSAGGRPARIAAGFKPRPSEVAILTEEDFNSDGTVNFAKVFKVGSNLPQAGPQLSLGSTPSARPAQSLSKMQVEQAVRELFSDSATPPNFQVTHNYGKVFNGREVRGWYDPATGTIWLNAAYLRSPQEARAVFVEEAFHAIQNDKSVQKELSRLVASLTPEQLAEARSAYGNISEEQLRMEAVADILEKQQLTQEQRGILARLWDAVLGAVQRLYGKFAGKVFTERDAQDVLAKALKAAAVGKRSLKSGGEVYADGDAASAFQYSKVPTGKYSPQQLAAVANEFRALAANPNAFKYPTSTQTDITKIAQEMAPEEVQVSREESEDGDSLIKLTSKNGSIYINDVEGDRPYIVSTDAGSAGVKGGLGSLLYQIAFTWAHNNGKMVVASPSLSEIAILRRTSNMLSSALRFGTTDHLRPDPSQRVEWVKGDTWGNIARLALKEYELVNAATGGLSGAPRYNPETLSFGRPDRMQQAVSGVDRLAESQQERLGKYGGIGSTTLQRAVFTESALQRGGIPDGKVGQGAVENPEQAAYLLRLMQSDDAPQLLYGVGPLQNQLDQKYFEAIQRGDMQEVQALVDEAARGAGYGLGPLYHGTTDEKPFNEFKKSDTDSGIHFGSRAQAEARVAEKVGKRFIAAYLKSANMLEVRDVFGTPSPETTLANELRKKGVLTGGELADFVGRARVVMATPLDMTKVRITEDSIRDYQGYESILDYTIADDSGRVETASEGLGYGSLKDKTNKANAVRSMVQNRLAEKINRNPLLRELEAKIANAGYDLLAYRNAIEGSGGENDYSFAVLDSNQIKSADPITYDDQGQPIPLSQRFQQESPDIRYSLGEPVKGIANENAAWETNPARVAENLRGSPQVLRTSDEQINEVLTRANELGVARESARAEQAKREKQLDADVRGLRAGSKASAEPSFSPVRVFLSTDTANAAAGRNAAILANRLIQREAGGADNALRDVYGVDFVSALAGKSKLVFTIQPRGDSPQAETYYVPGVGPIVVVNADAIAGYDFSKPSDRAAVDGFLAEEIIHSAALQVATDSDVEAVWSSLSDKEKKATERSYNRRKNLKNPTSTALGHEYLRMVIQERMFGKTTEQVELRITEPVKKFLRKLLNFIKEAFGKKPENDIARQLVSRIESALNGELPRQSSIIPSGTSLATNISQSDATEVQGRAIEPSVIAAAGRAVADLGRQTVEEYEQAGRELEGLAYESEAFRQARSELNNLVGLHEGRLRQLPQDRVTDDMRANIRDGVSIENGQIVVGDELVTKLAQMGVQARPELVKAMQAEVHFEQQARRLVDNLGKLATLKELKDYYTRIKAPTDEIENLNKLISAKEKVVADLTPVTTNRGRGQQSIGERASEITRANASKVELQSKRDALALEPVQEFFGKGIAELRDLSEKAKAAADLTRALMDSTTSVSEVARLGAIYDKWAGFDATVKDALVKGTLTDEQRVAVLTDLQKSFHEFDAAKFRMDDLLNSEEKGLLKDIRLAEADIADAKVTSGLADVLVADALKAAKGEMGLTGTVGDAANIANLEASTGAITTLAMNLGRTIDQNRWLYDFLMAPGDMPAFGASVAQSLGISETALREVLKVVQQSPSLASAIVTLTDDAAAKLANSPPNQMQSIATLATSGNPVAMALAANLTSQIVQQANAQGTKANAARQAAARQLAQSVLRLRTLQQGQALFNQTANSPAFQQLRGAANAGAAIAQKMVVLGPTGPVLRGFKSAAKDYQPELKIDVDSNALELGKTRDKVWKYLQNAEQYVADYEAAAALHAANPANPSPSQLGFDVADYNGLRFAIENQIWPMFLNMGDMDDAARAAQYLTPVAVRKLMKAPMFIKEVFSQYEQIGKMVGGFAGNTFRQQIAKYKRGYLNAKRVASQFQDLPKLQSAAMRSHSIKNEESYRRLFNEMAHYGRLFGTPLRVGFTLPISNQIVTKEDMEFLKRTLAFEEKLRREVTEIDPVTGVRYMRGGKEITRKGAYVGDLGMPRHLNRDATQFIADVTNAYATTPKGFTPATDLSSSSTDEAVKYWNQHLGTLKQHILDSLRTDRTFKQTAEMAAAEKRIASRWLAGNMNQVNSVQDLVDMIAAEIPATNGINPLDTARQGLNNELLQYVAHAQRIQKERADDNAKNSGLSIALSSDNEFTKPAANLELPSEYYDYGAVSGIDRITALSRANHSSLVDFANSLRLSITELQNRIARLGKATTDKEREAILENYKGNPQEMQDVLDLLRNSLKNFEDSYRSGGPDIIPTKLGQKLLKATVGSVLAKVEIAARNLSQGQIQVLTNLWAMNYMSASLAAWKALSNVPRGVINTGYLVARNIAGFADRRLGRDPQFQRTLKGAVDMLADGIFKSAQLALLKPRVGAQNARASFERVQALGFDISDDWWETAKQAWTESGQFRTQLDQDNASAGKTARLLNVLERIANTGADGFSAFVRGSVLEASDLNMNALSLGLVGNMEQRLGEVAMVFGKRLTDAGITEIDPANKDAILKPNEWLPSLNQQTATNSLAEIRKFLESSAASEGFQLEKSLLQYYQDKMAGKPARIFNQRTFDAVQRSMIAENNAALPTNRASAGQASTLWRTMLALTGYPADAMLKLLRVSTGGSRDRKVVLQALSKMTAAVGFAAMAILFQGAGDAGSEFLKRKLQGKKADRVTPLDADFWTDPDHMKRAMGRYLMMSAYYLGDFINGAYGWVDGRSTIDPTQKAFVFSTASQILRDITSGAKIAMKGGSASEVLEPLRRTMTRLTFGAPELEYLLGKDRDTSEAARRAMAENARAKGFEIPSPGFGGTVGLTNVKRKALSQAVSDMDIAQRKGDTEGYAKAKAAAQKQLTELEAYYLKQRLEAGDSPEVAAKTAKASVWGDYQENNPVTAALGGKRPTAEQYKQLVESSTGERGQVIRQGIKAWQDGAQALFGKPGNITKEDVAENRPGGTVREPSYGRVSLTGGVSGRMKSVGVAPSRGRRAKIRRISLTGRRRKISPMRGRRKKIRRVRLTA